MTARYVADEAALREARCECGHPVDVHVSAGCNTYPGCDCRRDIAAALLASGVVQPREDVVREAVLPLRRFLEAGAVSAKALGRDDRDWLDGLRLLDHPRAALVPGHDHEGAK